jgi:hypothetical protein
VALALATQALSWVLAGQVVAHCPVVEVLVDMVVWAAVDIPLWLRVFPQWNIY